MLQPTIPAGVRRHFETTSHDAIWQDGRLYAVNPIPAGVAPGTNWSNPTPCAIIAAGNTVFTNVALTDDDVVGGGLSGDPQHLDRLEGQRLVPLRETEPMRHTNSRYCTPMSQCLTLPPRVDDPQGVLIRDRPAVAARPRFRWSPRRATGSTGVYRCDPSSEQTAAAEGKVGTCAATRWPCCRFCHNVV